MSLMVINEIEIFVFVYYSCDMEMYSETIEEIRQAPRRTKQERHSQEGVILKRGPFL